MKASAAASKAGAVFKKHWPLIVGGGIAAGLLWRFAGSSDSGGSDSGMSDADYYQYQLDAMQLAQANATIGAQTQASLQLAAAQASALQDEGQAKIISAQAGLAGAIGDTYSEILGVALLPQLEAMKQSGAVAQASLGAAAASQVTSITAASAENMSMFDMLTQLGYGNVATTKGAQAGQTSIFNSALDTAGKVAGSFFKSM